VIHVCCRDAACRVSQRVSEQARFLSGHTTNWTAGAFGLRLFCAPRHSPILTKTDSPLSHPARVGTRVGTAALGCPSRAQLGSRSKAGFPLEHSSQFEEPFLVAGMPNAAANEKRAKSGFRDHARLDVSWKLRLRGNPVHLANFVRADDIDLLPQKWRQSQEFANVTGAEQVILLAKELVSAVGA